MYDQLLIHEKIRKMSVFKIDDSLKSQGSHCNWRQLFIVYQSLFKLGSRIVKFFKKIEPIFEVICKFFWEAKLIFE